MRGSRQGLSDEKLFSYSPASRSDPKGCRLQLRLLESHRGTLPSGLPASPQQVFVTQTLNNCSYGFWPAGLPP